MRPVTLTLISQLADDNGISTTQALLSAGNLTITGALASGGVATMAQPSYIVITSAGDDSGITFAITGTDGDGAALSETITGADTGAAATIHRFKTVTQVHGSGATAANVIAGTAAYGYSEPCPMDYRNAPFNVGLSFTDTGTTVNFTVQTSGDNPWDYADADTWNAQGNWIDHPFMTGMQAADNGNVAYAVMGIRLKADQSGSDTGVLKITQAGL